MGDIDHVYYLFFRCCKECTHPWMWSSQCIEKSSQGQAVDYADWMRGGSKEATRKHTKSKQEKAVWRRRMTQERCWRALVTTFKKIHAVKRTQMKWTVNHCYKLTTFTDGSIYMLFIIFDGIPKPCQHPICSQLYIQEKYSRFFEKLK